MTISSAVLHLPNNQNLPAQPEANSKKYQRLDKSPGRKLPTMNVHECRNRSCLGGVLIEGVGGKGTSKPIPWEGDWS
jgi:hypothetical protein